MINITVIGNSAAGLAAVEAIRKIDKNIPINVISKEGGAAYSRVLLPYVLRGKVAYENMTIRSGSYYEDLKINYIEDEVTKLNTETKSVTLANGTEVPYGKLLIATGSNPVKPPIEGINADGIYHMWTKEDLDGLRPHFESGKRMAVIGSGFVSLQAAWAAVYKGLEVTVIELANRIMPNVIDDKGAEILSDKIRSFGVDLRTETLTTSIEKLDDGNFKIHMKDKEPVIVDCIVVGTGVRPNIQFLEGSSVTVDRGIPVNEFMETNVQDIYASGDVACGPTTFGEKNIIHALWPTALEMGEHAGINMIGEKTAYEGSLNMNVTQMYDLTVASMGRFSDALDHQTYIFPETAGKGYLKVSYDDGIMAGACLVGSTEAVKILGRLRPLIKEKKKIDICPEKLEMYLQINAFASVDRA